MPASVALSDSCAAARRPEARVVITTAPGEEGQVDYGDGPMVRHPQTGKYRRTRLFVLTLGYSRKAVRLLVWQSSTQMWAELHERAFRRLGGTPRTRPRQSQRRRAHAGHLRAGAQSALPRRARALRRRRPAVSRRRSRSQGQGRSQASGTRRRRRCAACASRRSTQAQAYLDRWEAHWADTRIHGTTKRQVAAMFAEERPALQPLPVEPFRYYRFGVRTVHLDGCVEVEAAYYSTPPGWIGQRVEVQWTDLLVRLLDPKTGQLLREHVRAPRGWHRIEDADRPARTPARRSRCSPGPGTPARISTRSAPTSTSTRAPPASAASSACSPWPRSTGPAAADEAAKAALELQVPTYRFLRRYLERRPARPAHAPASRPAHSAAHALPRSHRSADRRPT